jgi:hypothetical protein
VQPSRPPCRPNVPETARGKRTRTPGSQPPGFRTPSTPASGELYGKPLCGWPGSSPTHGPVPRNAVGAPSVKVGTAPDTPPRGQVLARHLSPDRPYRRAGPVTLRQLSGSSPPLRVHQTRGGCGEPEAGGVPRRATPAVWARSETPAPAMESGLAPRLLAAATGQASSRQARRAGGRGTGDSPRPGSMGGAETAVIGPADSPGRDTGSTGRTRGRSPLPGKDPS